MRKLLMTGIFMLSSCAPLLSKVQGDDATLVRDGASVLFSAGATDAEDVAVYLNGTDLTVTGDGAKCRVVSSGIGCALGTVPGGKRFRLIVTGGLTSGNATHYRPGSSRPVLTVLK